MGPRNVIALCGRAGAGKDAFAAPLLEDIAVVGLKFARPLKDAILALFPHMDERHVEGDLKDTVDPSTGATPRSLMQVIGTDLLQHGLKDRFPRVGRGVFVNALLGRVRQTARDVVVTDMRFPHELAAVRGLASRSITVTVVKVVRRDRDPVGGRHESETPIPDEDCDVVVNNDGSLTDLRSAALRLMQDLRRAPEIDG
jgi:hypothetical protein